MSINFSLFLRSNNLSPQIARFIALSVLLKIAISFSLTHRASLPYNIADLTQLLQTFPFIFNGNLQPLEYFAAFHELPPTNSWSSCDRCFALTSCIPSVILISELAYSFHTITQYFNWSLEVLHHASTFLTNKIFYKHFLQTSTFLSVHLAWTGGPTYHKLYMTPS